ncbi:hypothetical protein BDF20DRAFT_915634 [Mycotypha africana]|uniref:uncharacterized protein n=1 Tax=Mycotypha africana TaxID=64632 RepID=UPI0023009FEB|nr:uncharacterized protein BDF20DRAFT_915634 [Mycotypha africana]KAI8971882.1 hypothetical protein BDF20DRAFT_915634 [Mycotypha africana]
MKVISNIYVFLLICVISVLAKGGGGGRGGGGGGGGGRGAGGGSGSGGSRGGSSGGSTGRTGSSTGSTPPSVSSKGGSGGFGGPPPPYYANTRTSYRNYAPVYSGGYSPVNRYGYYGFFNPALVYFTIMPPFLFLGYHTAYHRYNQNNGYYYAPQLTESGSNTQNVFINGTANSGKDENYHYTFHISTDNEYPMADHAFFSTSDLNAINADFVYRLQFTHLIEFEDANQNGFYDSNEQIFSLTSLQRLNWQPFQVSNITVPGNSTQTYLQTSTSATVNYNNTASNTDSSNKQPFTVRITYRASNLQLNNTAPIVMQPNSLQYDFAIEGYPTAVALSRPNYKLAVGQVLSVLNDTPVNFDINMTNTPIEVANQIKTNNTYGISLGDYTQGRLEYQPTVNISNVADGLTIHWATPTTITADFLAQQSNNTNNGIWINNVSRKNNLLLISLPSSGSVTSNTNNNQSWNMTYSGFAFLDTDVMNALANNAGTSISKSSQSNIVIHVLLSLIAAVYLMLA